MADATAEAPQYAVGDTLPVEIVTDPHYCYVWAENMVVTHLPLDGKSSALELSALATQTAMISQSVTITSLGDGTATVGTPGPLMAMPQQVHKATIRVMPTTALNAAHLILAHMKTHGLIEDWAATKERFQALLED